MKVLLISNPPLRKQRPDFPPVGIASLGAVSRQLGHDTILIDSGFYQVGEIVSQAQRFSPDIIGITCWTIDREMVWDLCRKLKKKMPSTFIVLGGPHVSIFPSHIFRKTNVDAVVVGEGEQTFEELLTALKQNRNLKEILGLVLRGTDDNIFDFKPRDLIKNLDNLPFPFYQGFPHFSFSRYTGFPLLPKPTASIMSSRGCVFDCTYCGSSRFWGRQWRHRSAANILNEIEWLLKEHRIRSIYFFDDNFTVNYQRVEDICNEFIRRGWNLPWSCCSHVKSVNKELLALMKQSGCISIDFGVESGSNRILNVIHKQQTRSDIKRTFALVHEAGIKPRAYLMVGSPGEDESTIDETVQLINLIKPWSSIGATILWLLPGTSVYADAVANGHINDEFWLTNENVPYNLQEHSYDELCLLRQRLMYGIARGKGGNGALVNYYLKSLYYRFPQLAIFRHLIPGVLK
jgi:anaerobic magnesium-protoporphyrin IX monomethyl ester cyclase